MKTLKSIRGKYLQVLLAMCGLVSSSLGIMTNALGYPLLGLFFDRTGKYDGALIMIVVVILLSIAGVFMVYRLVSPHPSN